MHTDKTGSKSAQRFLHPCQSVFIRGEILTTREWLRPTPHLWVVAFSKNGHRAEARIGSNGTFSFPNLPPGEYGLKVGHDLFVDEDVTAEEPQAPAWKIQPPADPWKRAKIVAVASGKTTTVDDLTLPAK